MGKINPNTLNVFDIGLIILIMLFPNPSEKNNTIKQSHIQKILLAFFFSTFNEYITLARVDVILIKVIASEDKLFPPFNKLPNSIMGINNIIIIILKFI